MYYTTFDTPLWPISLAGDGGGLRRLHLETGEARSEFVPEAGWVRNDGFFDNVRRQLLEYLAGARTGFDVKLNPSGTAFQQEVWESLRTIPYGAVWTYGELADRLGRPGAARAVGAANGKNPIPIIVPCHRVVGSRGALTGFAFGLAAKEQLLSLEGAK